MLYTQQFFRQVFKNCSTSSLALEILFSIYTMNYVTLQFMCEYTMKSKANNVL